MYRVENKYYLPETGMWELEQRIASVLQPDPHNIDGKGYTISSIYFDDIYDTCLQETLAGNASRSKYRIRIYNDSFDFIQLEVKSKTYSWTLKHSSPINREEFETIMHGGFIAAPDIAEDPRCAFNLAMKTKLLSPKVIVTYDRNAYICPAGNVRITFDRNLRGSTLTDHFGDPELIYDYPAEGPGSVLEVKYDEYMPDYINQLLETPGLLRVNNSKYVLCRQMYER